MKKNFLITTGGSGGHVIPASIFYDHLIKVANLTVSIDNRAIDMLENPINEPIERSNSPAIISSATPTARMPISDETCK